MTVVSDNMKLELKHEDNGMNGRRHYMTSTSFTTKDVKRYVV